MSSIPEVKGLPILGNIAFAQDPLGFFQKSFDTKGSTFRYKIMNRKLIGTRDPKWLEHAFVKNQKIYTKDFSMKQIGLALGRGLLTNTGESWMRQRRLAQPAFYKKRLDTMIDVMEALTDEHINKLKQLPKGSNIYIDREMMTLTAAIALKTLLGEDMTEDMKLVQHEMAEIQEYLIKRIRNPLFTIFTHLDGSYSDFSKKMARIDTIIYRIIHEKRKNNRSENDLVTMLMEARDEDTGEAMPDKQLRDELLTIYVAGHETSAYALSWTFYELMKHPEALQKVKEEALSLLQEGRLGSEGLKKLHFTKAAINEGMRLHPPAYLISREVVDDDIIDGEPIHKGEVILFSIKGMHTDPSLWENPLQFRPERFLEENEATRKYFHPFGAGPRMCIGNHFAMMEITIVLAKLVAAFDFKIVPGQQIVPQPLVTLKPKNGIQLEIA
jgi:cytochrome P450